MQLSLKQSIREEIEGVYNTKEKQLFKNLEENLKQYDARLQSVQGEVAKRSEVEGKAIEGLLKVFENKIEQIVKEKLEHHTIVSKPEPIPTK